MSLFMPEEKSLTYKIDLDNNLLTEIFVGNKLRCLDCNTLIFEIVED